MKGNLTRYISVLPFNKKYINRSFYRAEYICVTSETAKKYHKLPNVVFVSYFAQSSCTIPQRYYRSTKRAFLIFFIFVLCTHLQIRPLSFPFSHCLLCRHVFVLRGFILFFFIPSLSFLFFLSLLKPYLFGDKVTQPDMPLGNHNHIYFSFSSEFRVKRHWSTFTKKICL